MTSSWTEATLRVLCQLDFRKYIQGTFRSNNQVVYQNALEDIVCKMAAILFRLKVYENVVVYRIDITAINSLRPSYPYWRQSGDKPLSELIMLMFALFFIGPLWANFCNPGYPGFQCTAICNGHISWPNKGRCCHIVFRWRQMHLWSP